MSYKSEQLNTATKSSDILRKKKNQNIRIDRCTVYIQLPEFWDGASVIFFS